MFGQEGRRRTSSGLRYLPALLGILGLAALTAWRLACVRLGPDPDTDAYGHFVIARQLLETPWNFKIHWVWLPLFHALLALGVQAGASLDQIRSSNAILAVLPPLVLFWALRQRGVPPPRASAPQQSNLTERGLPYLATFIAAATPTFNQVGTSGQMEVLFCLLLIGAAALLGTQRYTSAAVVLAMAVLTRYEAWAAVAAVALVFSGRRLLEGEPLRWGAIACVLLPALAVLAWAGARWMGGEPWFGFIVDNQQFAERALETRAATPGWQLAALGRYVFTVPWRVLGVCSIFALLGLPRSYRNQGVWFLALPFGVLFFLTLSSLTRSQLGLDRHFLSVVPFAATWAAHGVARVAEWLTSLYGRLRRSARLRVQVQSPTRPEPAAPARSAGRIFAVISGILCLITLLRLQESLLEWQTLTRNALPDARLAGRYLQTTPGASLIVCDEASVEVTSGLPSSRFVRAHVSERSIGELLRLSQARDVYVLSRAERMHELARLGEVSYGSLDTADDGFVAVHLPPRDSDVERGSTLTSRRSTPP
jgi:putative flippase GtrA